MKNISVANIVSVLTLIIILVSGVQLSAFLTERETVQGNWAARRAALTFADRLRQTSDDLTRMVRLYAVNGDPVYREYFDEILDIRNGIAPRPREYFSVPYWDIVLNSGERFGQPGPAVPIRTLARNARLYDEELALIEKAEDASNALAVIESEIMDVVAARIEAGDGVYALEGDALEGMLRLHGAEYHANKAQVMVPLAELGRNVNETFAAVRRQLINLTTSTLRGNVILLAITLAVIAVDLWLRRGGKGLRGLAGGRRNLFGLIAALLALVMVLVSLTLFINVLRVQPAVSKTISERVAARSFADSLRQTSDDLTRMVRLYAITGEPRYRDYFQEILDIRNGIAARPVEYFNVPYWDIVLDTGERPGEAGQAAPIRTLANNAGLSPQELAQFHKAEDASNALAVIESDAMDVVAALSESGQYELRGEALATMLQLHGPEYHAAKALVMQPLVELERLVQEQFAAWINATVDFIAQSFYVGFYAVVAAFFLMAASIWLRRR